MARQVVLFDGVCALCEASIRFLLDRDRAGRLFYAPLQGETAREFFSRHADVDGGLSTVVYVRHLGSELERAYQRSDAVIEVVRDLGGIWKAAALLRVVPRPVRDALYDWVAGNRYRWFGRHDVCRLPTTDVTGRFLP